ncbi:MAG: hypothetical protein ACOYXM_15240 [Actinomycetota bacterium]
MTSGAGGVVTGGLWPSPWPAEDGGPRRLQVAARPTKGLDLAAGATLQVTHRDAPGTTMVVLRDPGEVYVLRHGFGDDAPAWVEQVDPFNLDVVRRSPDLAGGPMWPGGLAAHADGTLHVVFGNHAHRLGADTTVIASTELPRRRPYNSFVTLLDGHLVTKDFAGQRPGDPDARRAPAQLLVLDPESLAVVSALDLPEPSIARLSADGDDIYIVGDTSLLRARWDGAALALDETFVAPYRTLAGQTYGWDAVIAMGAAWFLDDGEGTHRYAGTFRGQGISTEPLHIVRVDLTSGGVSLTEVCGLPGGLIANPPLVDPGRRIVVGYDSGNGVMAAFDIAPDGALAARWTRQQDHASHLLLFAEAGQVVSCDHDRERMADQVVLLDIETGTELARADTGSPLQAVVFPSVGWNDDVYICSMSTLSRVSVAKGH